MIIDKVENISKYSKIIPKEVIEFLKISPDANTGHYEIVGSTYANIEEYLPKPYELCKYEAHKKYIDLQMLLKGEEDLEYRMAGGLDILEDYNEERDIMFFKNKDTNSDIVHLIPYKFALIFPHEAHKPQIKTKSCPVKKVVVKISTLL